MSTQASFGRSSILIILISFKDKKCHPLLLSLSFPSNKILKVLFSDFRRKKFGWMFEGVS